MCMCVWVGGLNPEIYVNHVKEQVPRDHAGDIVEVDRVGGGAVTHFIHPNKLAVTVPATVTRLFSSYNQRAAA